MLIQWILFASVERADCKGPKIGTYIINSGEVVGEPQVSISEVWLTLIREGLEEWR